MYLVVILRSVFIIFIIFERSKFSTQQQSPCALGPVSTQALEGACCLEKTRQWPTSWLTLGGSPMPPAQRCPSKGTRMPLLVHSTPSQLVEELSSPQASMPTSQLTPGAHSCLLPDVAHRKAHGCPSPHATSALPVHSVPSRLVEKC